jgi:hypothetical protein
MKKCEKRDKWTVDEDKALYFTWNDQVLPDEALYSRSGKQPFDEFWQ